MTIKNNMKAKTIDILIPTFNRAPFLAKNLELLQEQIQNSNLEKRYRILVSNNCSTDETSEAIKKFESTAQVELVVYEQKENIGLERNAVFLLQNATADFVLYLGDDDYLPEGYLTSLIKRVDSDEHLGVVIPGFTTVDVDGNKRIARKILKNDIEAKPGFSSVLRLSAYGHQLSGLLLRRDGLFERYTADDGFRNIYPFIYFVAYNNQYFSSIYSSRYQVLVSISNSKDWRYDEIGLLGEIIKNYKILYPTNTIKQTLAALTFIVKQRWRLRVSIRPSSYSKTLNAVKHFLHSPIPSAQLKLGLIIAIPVLYLVELMAVVKRRIK